MTATALSFTLQLKSDGGSSPTIMSLELSAVVFRVTWTIIVGLHAICGAYLICVAMTYWYLTNEVMALYVSIWSLTGNNNYAVYAVLFGIVGGMHALQVLHLVFLSIKSRRLMLRPETSMLQSLVAKSVAFASRRNLLSAAQLQGRQPQSSRDSASVIAKIVRLWNTLFSRQGLFGVESEHFSTVFALREVLEVSSQTYQAYRSSSLLPRHSMNAFYVGLLITNCWSTAAVQYFLRNSPVLERIASLAMDAAISFAMMVVVPLVIFIPYVKEFDVPKYVFKDPAILYDPVGATSLVLENRLIFVSGIVDLSSKLIPQLSIFLSLVTVSALIARSEIKVVPGADALGAKPTMVKSKSAVPNSTTIDPDVKKSAQEPKIPPTPGASNWGGLRLLFKLRHWVAIVIFCIWGLIIAILHVMAAKRAGGYGMPGCLASTRPWFPGDGQPCSSLVYDCAQHNTMTASESSFITLEADSLMVLAFVHCPALEVPAVVQSFSSLIALHIYNSTIAEWSAASGIYPTTNPRFLTVLVRSTNMTEFPEGLHGPLPDPMLTIHFSQTNLTTLPDDLYKRWHPLAIVAFDHGILQQVPYQVFFMQQYVLSFANNQLQILPQLAALPPPMIIPTLRLSGNPLLALPEQLKTSGGFIRTLNVEDTLLTSLPAWTLTQTMEVFAHDTPYCEAAETQFNALCMPRPPAQNMDFPVAMFEEVYAYGRNV